MTRDKYEKAVIRARMAKTGESYTTAKGQLSREALEPTPPAEAQLVFTAPARRAVGMWSQHDGRSGWHLVLSLHLAEGTGRRVLEALGVPPGFEYLSDWDNPHPSGGSSWADAMAEVARRTSGSTPVDTGQLLQAAVKVLMPEEVPAVHREHAEKLRGANLAALCAADAREHGAEPMVFEGTQRGLYERKTVQLSRAERAEWDEARALNHNYIGTEHQLLGLLTQADGRAATLLAEHGVSLEVVRAAVEQILGRGEGALEPTLAYSPRATTVSHLCRREADDLLDPHIGTEHLLLALLYEDDGVAAQILRDHGLTTEACRAAVVARRGHWPAEDTRL